MSKGNRRILVATDRSAQAQLALDEGITAAAAYRNTELHVLAVVDSRQSSDSAESALDQADSALFEHVRARVQAAKQRGLEVWNQVITHVASGKPAQQIVQLASDLHADLVMVGTHSRTGVERLVVGSVAESVVRMAPCPVLVVREKDFSAGIPEIEPPCPDCVKTRAQSSGQELWCDRHRERHGRRHTYFSKISSGRPPYSGGIAT